MILSWSTNSKMWGASMRIPTVPMVVTRKKSHSWARSTTMATYFQSSRIWNRAGWTLLIQKKLSNHFKFFKMYQHLHSHRAWMWKACNLQGQCAQWKGGIPTELALSISSDLMWHFDWSWKSSLFSLTLFYSGSLFGFTCKFVVTSTLRVWKRVQNFWPKKFPPNNKRSQNAG